MDAQKLIVVSTRLPVSAKRLEDGAWHVEPSPGGLATALRSVASERGFTWVGWPGVAVASRERETVERALRKHAQSEPVFLEEAELEGFYEQFSNRILWPLLHGLPSQSFEKDAWETYRWVNERFADAVCQVAKPGDTIWVHDYQLMLVPQLLRRRGLDCPIGFFLHIPFPASETFRTLPVRESILRGVLGADLVGFHSYEYLNHFRSSALRILGVEADSDPDDLLMTTHRARLTALPIGIDAKEMFELARSEVAEKRFGELKEAYKGRKVILGVDRLDYTKGLPQKLRAFEQLLQEQPALRSQVVLIQVAAPSRTNVEEYQGLKREMDELVGRINGQHGTLDVAPLVYINQNVPRDKLGALYRLADVMLVTPVRDGMNLVCLEYVAARGTDPGTLILSEFTGAATCLSGARLVNPHDPDQLVSVLRQALEGQASTEAFGHMREFVENNTSKVWAERFLSQLRETGTGDTMGPLRIRPDANVILERARDAKRPLLVLDYDGTLRPHARVPRDAAPTPRVLGLLEDLARAGSVYVVSGRDRRTLEEWLGALPIGLSCEHGLTLRHPQGAWSAPPSLDKTALSDIVLPVLQAFTERTPGSRIEQKSASLAWHYRGCDPKLGNWRAKELRLHLDAQLAGHPFSILAGSKVVEIRHAQVTKGAALRTIWEHQSEADFLLCAGNDRTDEDMFDALSGFGPERRLTVHVGGFVTGAEFFVETVDEHLGILQQLADIWRRNGG